MNNITSTKLRRFLKQVDGELFTLSTACNLLKISREEVLQLLNSLKDQGYIQDTEVAEGCWQVSTRGKVLVHRYITRVFRVKTLQNHLGLLLERAATVNTSKKYPFYISCIKIFSEYPIQNVSGGIRMGCSLKRKPISEKDFKIAFDKLIREHKGVFDNNALLFGYPQKSVVDFLKSRSPALKISLYREDEIKEIEGHIVFEEDQDK